MRKDYKVGKAIKNRLYSTFEVCGLNLDKFLTTLNREGIPTLNANKKSNKKLILTIKNCYAEKFFAITRHLCYNVKRLKYRGGFLPLYWSYKNIGIVVGVIVLFVSSFWFGGRIMQVTYSGDGKVYSAYVDDFLKDKGIGKWTAFSSVDLKKLGKEIFASSERFSFVNCTRWGNNLQIKLIAKTTQIDRLDKNQKQVVCDISGSVERVKVLRGTAKVEVGQAVNPNDILIEGSAVVNDKVIETGIVGSVWVLYDKTFCYKSNVEGQEDIFETLACQQVGDFVKSTVRTENFSGEYEYTVTVTLRKVFSPL